MTGKKFLVETNIRKYMDEKKKIRISANFFEEIENIMKKKIDKAAKRAKDNFRNTVMAKDL